MQQYRSNSYLFGGNAPYVEELYEAYLDNPGSVPDNWRAYFDALQNVPAADGTQRRDVAHAPVVDSFAQRAKANAVRHQGQRRRPGDRRASRSHVQSLIAAYRFARLPLGRPRPAASATSARHIPELEPAFYGLTEADHGHRVQHQQHLSSARRQHDAARDLSTRCARPTAARSAPSTCTSPTRPRSAGGRSGSSRSARKPSFSAEEKKAHPRAPDRGRRPRALPAHQVRRPEALLARRRRELHRLDGRADPARRRARACRRS